MLHFVSSYTHKNATIQTVVTVLVRPSLWAVNSEIKQQQQQQHQHYINNGTPVSVHITYSCIAHKEHWFFLCSKLYSAQQQNRNE